MLLPVGQIIESKYRIVGLVGEGGMGAVYEGENVRINRRVAIKVLHANVAENKEAVQRFEREAQAAGRIGNDHILEVLDLGTLPSGDHFMVMEYLDGEPLSLRIRRLGRMVTEDLCPVIRQVLVGLEAAHNAGIVHRDLKPDNIFILKEKYGHKDFVKLIDFGVSKFNVLSDDMKMTRTGAVVGTPYYMSPEQASGSQATDARSDVYAVGVILYEAVTGHVPFDAPTFNQLMFQIVLSSPVAATELVPSLDPAFGTIISKAMARDPASRFQSTRELLDAIDAWEQNRVPVSVPPDADPYAMVSRGIAPGAGAPLASSQTQEAAVGTLATAAAAGQQPYGSQLDRSRQEPAPPQGQLPAELGATPGPRNNPQASTLDAGRSGGSWASSQLGVVPKSGAPVWAVATGAVVLVGGIAAWLLLGSSQESTASTGPTEAVEEQAAVPAAPPTPAPVDTQPVVVPSDPVPLATAGKDSSEKDAGAEASAKTTSTKTTKHSSLLRRRPVRPKTKATATPRPKAASRPPPPIARPKTNPKKPTPASSTPDFGY